MRSVWSWPTLLLLSATGFALPLPVAAFECTVVPESRTPLTQAWNQRCLPFWINSDSPLLIRNGGEALVEDSFAQWSNPDCTDLLFVYAGPTGQRAAFDDRAINNQNVVLTVDSEAEFASLTENGDVLLAITLTSYSTATGEIFDADIVLNTSLFSFADVTDDAECSVRGGVYDLRNTLVHEVGHFIGFDHTPDVEATMFARAQDCEIIKRDLNATDEAGLCSVYAAGMPPQTCAPPADYGEGGALERFRDQCNFGKRGCACAAVPWIRDGGVDRPHDPPRWPFALVLWGGLAVGWGWRRRRQRS